MTTLTLIRSATLKALIRFVAGVKDSRYYLRGVYFDPTGYAVATDGLALLAVRVPAFILPAPMSRDLIIPIDTLKLALQLKAPELAVTADSIGGIPFQGIDGRFPDWRRIVPKPVAEPVAADFRPDLLQRAIDAFRDMGLPKSVQGLPIHVVARDSAGLMVCESVPDAIAVLMPYRTDKLVPADYTKHVDKFLAA